MRILECGFSGPPVGGASLHSRGGWWSGGICPVSGLNVTSNKWQNDTGVNSAL